MPEFRKAFLQDNTEYLFAHEAAAEARKWIEQKLFKELKQRHPNNPLFKEQFEGVEKDYVTVYNFIQEADIDALGESGLKPLSMVDAGSRKKNNDQLKTDLVFDAVAPKGFDRTN